MVFSVSDDFSWRIGWAQEAWRFKTGQSVGIALFVDRAGPFNLKAEAVDEHLAVAELPDNVELFDLLRKGNRLTVRALGNTYTFSLDGTYKALTELLGCVGRYASASGSDASVAGQPDPQGSAGRPDRANVDRSGKSNEIRLVLGDGTELKPQAVFEKVSAAVYVVRAEKSLGSAIAIGPRELLTNCHVVGRATAVTLEREGASMPAKVVSANPEADRCVLRVDAGSEAIPTWVRVRPYADIKIGERAFTVGAPRGFELSLAEGIVSSKRVKDDGRLIQTSAPISEGSSGGGLFDAQGNLIGITTFMIRDAQNLNFAIAAEEYVK